MRVFSIRGAEHYCQNFQPAANVAQESVEDFNRRQPRNTTSISEGSALFEEYRACALRDAERYLFLAASHYRRALDLMVPSSSHWAHVTLYYGSWFAAHALLGMFGCQVLSKHIFEVAQSAPGNQSLMRRRIGNGQNRLTFTRNGSHQRFWEAFYSTAPHFTQFANPQYAHVLTPISSNEMWLIDQRNRINYKGPDSIASRNSFVASFSSQSFPNSLPGELNTQYSVCEGLLLICYTFAGQFQLSTDALNALGSQVSFRDKVKQHIYDLNAPNLVDQTIGQQIFGI